MSAPIFIILLGIIQGIILGTYLLTTKRGNNRANKILGIMMILFSFSISHAVLYPLGLYNKFPHLIMLNHPILFLFGPLFYFYQKVLINKEFQLDIKHLAHFIPFVIYVLFLAPFYLQSADKKLDYINGNFAQLEIIDYVVTPLQIVHLFIYLIIVRRDLKGYNNNIKESYSSIEEISLKWLRTFVNLFIGVYGLMILILIIFLAGYKEFAYSYGAVLIGLIVSVCIYAVGYKGLSQPEIFVTYFNKPEDDTEILKDKIKEIETNESIIKLESVMKEKKLFLNSELTLHDLANSISIPAYQLSRLLNENLNQNFYDFVNSYRVNEVKKRLNDNSYNNLSILGIAYDCGFNSKSVFNTVFKKFTKMTPSKFKKLDMIKNSDSAAN